MSELETPVPPAQGSHSRRLIALIAAATLAAAGIGVAVAVDANPVFDAGIFTDQAVPWAGQQVARPAHAPRHKPQPRPEGPPCQAGALESLWPENGSTFSDPAGGSDSTGVAVLVRNIGSTSCTLGGPPAVQGLDRAGKPVGNPAEPGNYLPSQPGDHGPATIEPGEPARILLSVASQGCAGPQHNYHGAKVSLDNGFRIAIQNAWLSGRCPLKVSAWEPLVPEVRQFWGLEARLVGPAYAEAGTELTYVVELTNITSREVSLEPCLVFTQVFTVEDHVDPSELDETWHSTHRINCAPKSVRPKSFIRYQMKLPIPADFPAGKAHIFWFAEDGMHPRASAALNITNLR